MFITLGQVPPSSLMKCTLYTYNPTKTNRNSPVAKYSSMGVSDEGHEDIFVPISTAEILFL